MSGHKWEGCKSPEELASKETALKNQAIATLRFLEMGVLYNPDDVGTWIHRPGNDNGAATVSLIAEEYTCGKIADYVAAKTGASENMNIRNYKGHTQITIPADVFDKALQAAKREAPVFPTSLTDYDLPAFIIVHGAHSPHAQHFGWQDEALFQENPTKISMIISPGSAEPDTLKHAQKLCPGLTESGMMMDPGGYHHVYQLPEAERLAAIQTLDAAIKAPPSLGRQ